MAPTPPQFSNPPLRAPVRGLLFDLDGTLIATRRLYLEAFADALEPVLGQRPTHDEMMAHRPRSEIRFLREVTAIALRQRDPAADDSQVTPGLSDVQDEVLQRFFESYRRRHPDDFEGVYTGVPEMLAIGRARGLPMGMVTGKSRRSWSITEPLVDLGAFEPLVFDDDVEASKPDPAGIHLALETLATPAGGTLYIGDSLTDLEAAANAGVVPVGVLWSKRDHEREAFVRAAHEQGGLVLPTPAHLESLLEFTGAG